MALALANRGVRVNAVAPGTIATELARSALLTSDEARARIMSRTPMGRLDEPAEIADVVACLLSDAASHMTGEIVVVDGGRMTLNYTMPAPDSRRSSAQPGIAHLVSQLGSTMGASTSGANHGDEHSPVPARPFDGGVHAAVRQR